MLQIPEQLASAGAARHVREQERDEQELAKVADMERAQKRALLLKLSSRYNAGLNFHSWFSG